MKDNKQNLTDLIGALAVDIEEIKKKLDAKDSPDKNEALKRLEAKLEPVIPVSYTHLTLPTIA